MVFRLFHSFSYDSLNRKMLYACQFETLDFVIVQIV